jgi:hypothetical protein
VRMVAGKITPIKYLTSDSDDNEASGDSGPSGTDSYYDGCHAVAYVRVAQRGLGIFWCVHILRYPHDASDSVFSSPQIFNVPLLILANKQDSPDSLRDGDSA